MADEIKMVTCGRCGGTGQYVFGYGMIHNVGVCFRCHGTGKTKWNESASKRRETMFANQMKRADEWFQSNPEFKEMRDSETFQSRVLEGIAECVRYKGKQPSEKQIAAVRKQWAAHQDYLQRKAERLRLAAEKKAERKAAGLDVHVGTIGKRMESVVKVTFNKAIETNYGTSSLLILEDKEGHKFKCFYSGYTFNVDWCEDQFLPVKFTVKQHGEYNGEKYTQVSRIAVNHKIVSELEHGYFFDKRRAQ